jgi:hypothetical protein
MVQTAKKYTVDFIYKLFIAIFFPHAYESFSYLPAAHQTLNKSALD